MDPYTMAALTLFQAISQVTTAKTEANALKADAEMRLVQTDGAVALEKASAAEEALDRAKRLRQVVGRQVSAASGAGISLDSGTIGNLVEDSSSEFTREQGISEFNTNQRTRSLRLGAEVDANNLRFQAKQRKSSGYMEALGTIGSFGAKAYDSGWFSKAGAK